MTSRRGLRVTALRLSAGLFLALAVAPSALLWAGDRALLVGLDRYADERVPPTPGGVADARAMAALARDIFGFPAAGIRLLVDEQASSTALVETFRDWLIEGTRPGDRVLFFYAGHGSRLPDDNGDEDDDYDETLAPHDVDPLSGARQIRDDLLDSLVAELAGRRAVLIFDSCHSGTVTRGRPHSAGLPRGGGVRYLPRPQDFRALNRAGGLARGEDGWVVSPGAGSDVLDQPQKASPLSGVVVISAAGPGQLAYPLEVDGEYRGALSLVFEHVYRPDAASMGHSRGFLGFLKRVFGGLIRNLVFGSLGGGLSGGQSGLVIQPGALQQLDVGTLQSALSLGLQRLQETGHLEGAQQPEIETLAAESIDEEPLFGDWQRTAQVALENPLAAFETDPVMGDAGGVEPGVADGFEVGLAPAGERPFYAAGDQLAFVITSSRPGFLYLLVFSEERRATCIFPNSNDRNNAIPAGEVRLPSHPGYVFPVQEPFGRDVVVALVAREPLELCEKVDYAWEEVYARIDLQEAHERFRELNRGIGVRPAGGDEVASWRAATLLIETVP